MDQEDYREGIKEYKNACTIFKNEQGKLTKEVIFDLWKGYSRLSEIFLFYFELEKDNRIMELLKKPISYLLLGELFEKKS